MNILIINPMLYTAPLKGAPIPRWKSIADTMIVDLCKGFVLEGHNVTLIASEEYKPLDDEDLGFEIVYFENWISKIIKRFPHGFPLLKGLKDYLKNYSGNYDFIISSELFTPYTITVAKQCPEKLIVWQEFGFHLPFLKEIPSKIWHKHIVKKYIKKNVLVVPRASVTKEFVKHYCDLVSDEVINNCINTDIFTPVREKEDYLIIVSRLIPGKNIEYILLQFINYRCHFPLDKTKLVIVGDGPERNKLEEIVNGSGMEDEISFKGRMSHAQLASVLAKAKGFLCCTNAELNMISMTEAIVAGTPVLTNCIPLQYALVQGEQLGIAKDEWNYIDIKRLVENSEVYSNNCNRIRMLFSNRMTANQFVNVALKYNRNARLQ